MANLYICALLKISARYYNSQKHLTLV